jgi:AcrR family transcriptional regulator
MPRAGLNSERVVRAAGDLADERGYANLTLAALADSLGVRQPSLYKHIDSLDGLQRSVAIRAKRELGDVLARATVGRSGPDAVRAMASAYRHWVLGHPGRYAATVRAPSVDDPEDLQVSDAVVSVVLDVLGAFHLQGVAGIDAARTLRSALHGFVALESVRGFGLPRDSDRSYEFLVEVVISGLEQVGERSGSRSPSVSPDHSP